MDWMLMPLRRYAEFSGRSQRKEYWMFVLFTVLVYVVMGILMGAMGAGAIMGMAAGSPAGLGAMGGGALIVAGLFMLFALGILIPSIAVAIRRLHDTDRAGWWLLAPVAAYPIQLVGVAAHSSALLLLGGLVGLGLGIMLIVFYCQDGTPGPNNYGPDPKLRGDMTGERVIY